MDQAAAPISTRLVGEPIVPGRGTGELLAASVGLSFWGGVDAVSGTVIDRHHPLCGESVAGKVLALPGFPYPNLTLTPTLTPTPTPSPNPDQVLAIPSQDARPRRRGQHRRKAAAEARRKAILVVKRGGAGAEQLWRLERKRRRRHC